MITRVITYIENFGITGSGFLSFIFFILILWAESLRPETIADTIQVFVTLAPIWIPIALGAWGWHVWVEYIRARTISKMENVLLEIKLPREIEKTPLAMETIFSTLHRRPGESTFIKRYINGNVRPWWSFEIVSIEGEIHFFIWTRKDFRRLIEADIYAQYPNIEIFEASDYTRSPNVNPKFMWGLDYTLDREDAYPIRTYIDYGLHETQPKEEQKVDPFVSVLEFLGSLGKGEQLWFQIMIRVNRDSKWIEKKHKKGTVFGKIGWQEEAKNLINDLMKRDPKTLGSSQFSPSGFPIFTTLSPGEQEELKAIERSVTKLGYDCGMRAIYMADQPNFNASCIYSLIYFFKPFWSNKLNRFVGTRWGMKYDYPWQDFKDMRWDRDRRRLLDAYKRRSYFHEPYKTLHFVMNTEELATIYHFPGQVAQTPTLGKIQSTKAEAPPNLPV